MSTAATHAQSAPDRLDLYLYRDELAQSYNPANAHERMFVTEIAQAWKRLQKAYDREEQFYAGRPMNVVMAQDAENFKLVMRYLAECERAWRRAVETLEKSQRRRFRMTLASPNSRTSRRFFGRVPVESLAETAPAPAPVAPPSVAAESSTAAPAPSAAPATSEIHQIEKIVETVAAPGHECYIGFAATQKPNVRASAKGNLKLTKGNLKLTDDC
jgi:hypothetical protein